ncbi:choline ABC transporter substrate-binding protein [Pseudomonas guariconensis]|uniref:choline ABC transporter substrate-binding protein n=1 Tax=Pseudomonas TaxID=286 RepID=UPI002096C059|nr:MULTISPECIES: choline ABC transporter substrate-binding protein [Pseudomonas]MCO7639906.1 choline ABC transporter substrate-binding protein [Pseudomonas sp. S 311-6]MCO7515535.1 choline ABC transporter substrate-binding protein [Pseudomonas putida]MCO7565295.1 choline ABC transporter substrate-binding protein [Pseudomonas mosselii]MCO7605940.1 choline ABC transporter substrate-binding protein [Pseudomonas guariconensis]MCO7617574.1 choline ABC transporter substrate-binding protein [Pseudomo
MNRFSTAVIALALGLGAVTAHADSDTQCSTVKMADPGWSDIASTNAIARLLLESLGYQVKIDNLAVPIIYGGLKDGRVDAFLGNWMPAQQGFHDKFIASGDVQRLARNLEGTEFTLAVPDYVWNAGVKDFSDLRKYADRFDKKLYGIGSGAPANLSLKQIIDKNEFDLGQWKLVESSEQAMLAQVQRATQKQQFITFLGWTPHPMNVKLKMHYLSGGEKWFGGKGDVYTLVRNGYPQACPNAAKLLGNLTFTLDMENAIMAQVVDKKVSFDEAAKGWVKAHPQLLEGWLAGVTTRQGGDALAAVKAKL